MRLARPTGGIWEAADVQWWSRLNPAPMRATADYGHLFWLRDEDTPLAAVLLTGFGRSTQCDVFVLPDDADFARTVWRAAITRADASASTATASTASTAAAAAAAAVEFPVRLDDTVGIAELTSAGLRPADGDPGIVTSWLAAARRPPIRGLADGYHLRSRADAPSQPHHLIPRNGPLVEQRLRKCSLYQPELDLCVVGPDGRTAGYGLFWADQVTGVGLVEPMRTEQAHQRLGIASHLLAAGLDRLAASGCWRLKVSNDLGMYLRAGFQPLSAATAAIYSRPSPTTVAPSRSTSSASTAH
jgi:predicted N-acetyltransferase YhbS